MEIDSLCTLIKYPLSTEDKALIQSAYDFAKSKHEHQQRNSGEPYFVHVFAVAKNCAELGMDIETIVAALLHDSLDPVPGQRRHQAR